MRQKDWVEIEADRHRRLLSLQQVIATEKERDLPYSPISIRITLKMIRREYGEEAAEQTAGIFGLDVQ